MFENNLNFVLAERVCSLRVECLRWRFSTANFFDSFNAHVERAWLLCRTQSLVAVFNRKTRISTLFFNVFHHRTGQTFCPLLEQREIFRQIDSCVSWKTWRNLAKKILQSISYGIGSHCLKTAGRSVSRCTQRSWPSLRRIVSPRDIFKTRFPEDGGLLFENHGLLFRFVG